MAQINNSDLTKEIIDVARLHPARDKVPDRLADAVVPVIDVNPNHARVCNIVKRGDRTTTGSTTIYTTPNDRDFFLVAVQMSFSCDATADSTSYSLDAVPFGEISAVNLIEQRKQTTTVTTQNISLPFPIPIRIARNTAIRINQTFTVGASSMTGTIIGFTVLP